MTMHRRRFLTHTAAVGIGSLFGPRFVHAITHASPRGPFRRCVVLWMAGGPSQQDTFDPKHGGPRHSVDTGIAEVRFSETLPGLAQRAEHLCVVRSVGSREGEHGRATELLHTGFTPVPAFPRPAMGSLVSANRVDPGFPRYVTLGEAGFGAAYLGNQHSPFVIGDLVQARSQLVRLQQRRPALELLARFNGEYRVVDPTDAVGQRTSQLESVRELLGTRFPDAINIRSVDSSERNRYGADEFGQRVLAARRLLKLGVPFVEVQLNGWDTHVDNQRRTDQLCRQLETPWIALMDDLQREDLWDDTLIVWMGEFGRTPRLNSAAGRDHYPELTPVVLAGGNLGGRVIGQTSDDGTQRVGVKHSVADLMATLLTLMGIDIDQTLTTDFGSPTTVTDGGQSIL